MAKERKSDMTVVSCNESLDISTATELHQSLKKVLESGKPVCLQAQQVERADTAALQVLATFMRAARKQKITVSWVEPSAALRRSAELLGLALVLELPP